MLQKPKHLGPEYGAVFQDRSVVEAYSYRPPYPAEVFAILAGLITGEPRHVLDVGCGIGYIARHLVERVERLDAVDLSHHMLEEGKRLPNGDNPRLRWLYGAAESVELDPPYALITAGESLHWMDWNIVLPRFAEMLLPGGYLAIVSHDAPANPWFETLREIIPRYSTNKDFKEYDMLKALEQHDLFTKVGEKTTAPIPFVQSIEDYIESFHARNGFSRERMGPELAAAFDEEARKILLRSYPDGIISFQDVAEVVWGIPQNASHTY